MTERGGTDIVQMSEEKRQHKYCQDCLSVLINWGCNLPSPDDCWDRLQHPKTQSAGEACIENK